MLHYTLYTILTHIYLPQDRERARQHPSDKDPPAPAIRDEYKNDNNHDHPHSEDRVHRPVSARRSSRILIQADSRVDSAEASVSPKASAVNRQPVSLISKPTSSIDTDSVSPRRAVSASRPRSREISAAPVVNGVSKMSNQQQIKNALTFVCLAGEHFNQDRVTALGIIDKLYQLSIDPSTVDKVCAYRFLFSMWGASCCQTCLLYTYIPRLTIYHVYCTTLYICTCV